MSFVARPEDFPALVKTNFTKKHYDKLVLIAIKLSVDVKDLNPELNFMKLSVYETNILKKYFDGEYDF